MQIRNLSVLLDVIITLLACLIVKASDLPGHLQPLGSHQLPMKVDVVDRMLDPLEFFDNYVKPSKPVLMKGAAKAFPSYNVWRNDSYLKVKHGNWSIVAEQGKKETRSKDGVLEMSYSEFLDTYNTSDLYLVQDIEADSAMAEDVFLPKCLLCSGLADHLVTSVMWFSSGGTRSVLHNDDLENINCLYDGTKELVMIDKKHRDLVPIDRPEGSYSSVDVEKVDMNKYPTLSKVPWYEARMEAGDCFYIPFRWYHHVTSLRSRNLAINLWWTYIPSLPSREDCAKDLPDLPNYRPLSSITLLDNMGLVRSKLFEFFNTDTYTLTYDEYMSFLYEASNSTDSPLLEELSKFFRSCDGNDDDILNVSEVYAISPENLALFNKLLGGEEEEEETEPESEDAPRNDVPPGHLQPLGSHMSPMSIEERSDWPDPVQFFEKYTKDGKPVLFRGLAKQFPGFEVFRDDTILKQDFGDWKVEVEEGKKENRSKGTFQMSFHEFLDKYQHSDMYLVEDIKTSNKLADNVFLPKPLLCAGFTDVINTAVMWFSSGSTKSVLHNDAYENLNCVYDGTKRLVLIDKKHKSLVPIDVVDESYSSVDVDKVDMLKFPTLGEVPWYNVTMEAGDCLYIPMRWYHQVNSMPSRNLAINIWWYPLHQLRHDKDCPEDMSELPEYRKLSDYKFASGAEKIRFFVLGLFDEDTGSTTLQDLLAKIKTIPDAGEEQTWKYFFNKADTNSDGLLTVAELYDVPSGLFALFDDHIGVDDADVGVTDDVTSDEIVVDDVMEPGKEEL